ncbi:MAG TPA: hypothetical protein PLU72_10355 [Candidatus Ozemobacteraceae bacterium]|nr:hypothetical protein [Candidatus Ozemobacteraceae bacterium]HQG27942.1 hypothetical protein [Candidatus Ozemobacteraceae bacterium]
MISTSLRALLMTAIILGFPGSPACAKEPTRIEDVVVSTSDTDGSVEIRMTVPAQPVISWIAADSCWRLDFPGVTTARTAGDPLSSEFRGPLRQIWLGQVNQDPPVQRFNLYVKPGTGMKVAHTTAGLTVRLKVGMPIGSFSSGGGNAPLPAPLMLPGHGGGSVEIDVKRAPVMPLLGELSKKAGITLRLRDDPPALVSFRTQSDSAMAALNRLALRMGMTLTQEDGEWWLSSKRNPLLKLPSNGLVSTAALHGITVREALNRLGGRELGKKLCDGVSPDLLSKKPDLYPEGLSPRSMAQYLREIY